MNINRGDYIMWRNPVTGKIIMLRDKDFGKRRRKRK
jgi:hypothetical protein